MYVTYIDESKYDPVNGRRDYIVAGLVMPAPLIAEVEAEMNALAKSVFGRIDTSPDTEFHAKDLLHAKRHFKGMGLDDRIAIYIDLLKIAKKPEIGRIYSQFKVDKVQIYVDDYHQRALMFFVEKLQAYMSAEKGKTLLIADNDPQVLTLSKQMVHRYKTNGTDWQYGRKIDCLLDGIHFADSAYSRLVQLADIYTYGVAFRAKEKSANRQSKLLLEAMTKEGFPGPNRYKEYPLYA